jgi:hypothetical protein
VGQTAGGVRFAREERPRVDEVRVTASVEHRRVTRRRRIGASPHHEQHPDASDAHEASYRDPTRGSRRPDGSQSFAAFFFGFDSLFAGASFFAGFSALSGLSAVLVSVELSEVLELSLDSLFEPESGLFEE